MHAPEDAEAPGVSDGGGELGAGGDVHTREEDGMADAEELRDRRGDRRGACHREIPSGAGWSEDPRKFQAEPSWSQHIREWLVFVFGVWGGMRCVVVLAVCELIDCMHGH